MDVRTYAITFGEFALLSLFVNVYLFIKSRRLKKKIALRQNAGLSSMENEVARIQGQLGPGLAEKTAPSRGKEALKEALKDNKDLEEFINREIEDTMKRADGTVSYTFTESEMGDIIDRHFNFLKIRFLKESLEGYKIYRSNWEKCWERIYGSFQDIMNSVAQRVKNAEIKKNQALARMNELDAAAKGKMCALQDVLKKREDYEDKYKEIESRYTKLESAKAKLGVFMEVSLERDELKKNLCDAQNKLGGRVDAYNKVFAKCSRIEQEYMALAGDLRKKNLIDPAQYSALVNKLKQPNISA